LVKKQNVEKEDLSSLADKVQYGIVEVRNVSHALKPDVLENFGLVPALVEVCNNLSAEIGPSISFTHIDVERRFEEDIEINVYRIAQELVNNCIKHAKAKDVFVTLIKDEDKLVLTVEDDGEGMADLDHTGIGLNNVKLRADIINGEMNIDSAVGKGSLINIEVPI
jgi:signal transduction histidine kinase